MAARFHYCYLLFCDILSSELQVVRVSCYWARWQKHVSQSSIIFAVLVGRHHLNQNWRTSHPLSVFSLLFLFDRTDESIKDIMCEQKCECFPWHSNECCHQRTFNCIETGTKWDVESQNHLVLLYLFPSLCWMLRWLCLIWNDSFFYLHVKSVVLFMVKISIALHCKWLFHWLCFVWYFVWSSNAIQEGDNQISGN